ncbi:MAG: MATE family efflux transporter [Alphaproteobacteria bacterium]
MSSDLSHAGDPSQAPPAKAAPIPAHLDRRLIEGPIAWTLIVFALPLMGSNLLHSVSGTVGAIWVSHVLGADALTAVVNGNVILFMLLGMIFGIGMASNIIIGQSFGAGNLETIKRVAGTTVAFGLLCGLVLVLIGVLFTGDVVDLLRVPDEARGYAVRFLRGTCLSMPSIFVFILISMMLRGCGDARTPFRYTLLWVSLQMVFGPILLTGAFGFPKLGIIGFVVGNVLANGIALAAMLRAVYRKDHAIALRGPELRFLVPDPTLLALLFRRGLPMAAESLLVQGAYVTVLAMVNDYGAATASAYGAVSQLWAYVQMPVMAISASIASMASQNIGAGRWDRVDRMALRGCLIGVGVTGTIVLAIYALGDLPLRLFLPDGGEALDVAIGANSITLWSWIFLAVTFGLFGVIRANGAMVPPTLILAGTLWLARIPFAQGFEPMFGVGAIWWSFPVGTIVCALVSYAYYRWGGWRDNDLMLGAGPKPAGGAA